MNEQPTIPPIEDKIYEDLIEAARWPVTAKPWRRMADTDCFVVIDPETGERQIAAVMGQGDQFYALHLYQPEEGVRWLARLHLSEARDRQCAHDAQFDQRLLEAEFTDGADLDPHDEELHERFGPLTSNQTPKRSGRRSVTRLKALSLRAIHPGCPPWHPSQAEARRLLDGLRLLRRYYTRHLSELGWAVFVPDGEGEVMLPTFRLPDGARRDDPEAWTIELESIPLPPPKQVPNVSADDLFVARLSRLPVKPGTRWEQGALFAPNPILDEGIPVFPVIGFVAVVETNRVEGAEVVSSRLNRAVLLRRSFSKTASNMRYLPETLVVGSPIAELALADLAQETGIQIVAGTEGMPLFNEMAQGLLNSPGLRPPHDDEEVPDFSSLPAEALKEIEGLMRSMAEGDPDESDIERLTQQLNEIDPEGMLLNHFRNLCEADDGSPTPGGHRGGTGPLELFTPNPVDTGHYVMRIDLIGIKPAIWRRLSLPAEASFLDLHRAIQESFDWDDSHLHEFQHRDRNRIVQSVSDRRMIPDADREECETQLNQIFTANIKKLHYIYDFGDNWTHLIKIEKKVPAEKGETGPKCHAGRGIAPLEDCGGLWGYQQLLEGTSEFSSDYDEEVLRHHREGKFSPEDVEF